MDPVSTTSYSHEQWSDVGLLGIGDVAAGSMYFQDSSYQQISSQQGAQQTAFGSTDAVEVHTSSPVQLSPHSNYEPIRSSPTFVQLPRPSPTNIPQAIASGDRQSPAQRRQSSYNTSNAAPSTSLLYGPDPVRAHLAMRHNPVVSSTSPRYSPYPLPAVSVNGYHSHTTFPSTTVVQAPQPYTPQPALGLYNGTIFPSEQYAYRPMFSDTQPGSGHSSSDSEITPPLDFFNPLPPSHPVGASANALPPMQTPLRTVGQRVDADTLLLNGSFRGSDNDSRRRRATLDDIMRQDWYINHDQEPHISGPNDPLARGLGSVGRSIYTVFLAESPIVSGGSSDEHPTTTTTGWVCLFDGSDDGGCKRGKKRFGRLERAVEHVRSHMGHRPFACNDQCQKGLQGKAPCQKRFFAGGYLEDHLKRRERRINCPDCGQSTQVQNLTRHQQRHRSGAY